jgi:hypothetical protein
VINTVDLKDLELDSDWIHGGSPMLLKVLLLCPYMCVFVFFFVSGCMLWASAFAHVGVYMHKSLSSDMRLKVLL